MAKKFLLILSLIVISTAVILIFREEVSHEIKKTGISEATENRSVVSPPENIHDAHEWEFLRHRDPATGRIPANIRQAENDFVNHLRTGNVKSGPEKLLESRWNRRGPWQIGGRTRALGIDILNENNIIAGGVSGGMWRSTDDGKSWTKTSTYDQLHSVSCLTQDTRVGKENIWYYGTGEFWGNSAHINGDGIFKSTDGGKSWFLLDSTATNKPDSWDNKFEYIWRVVTDHTNPEQDVVLAATCLGGIYRSTNGGNHWDVVLGGWGNAYSYFTDLFITPKGVFYATLSEMSPQQSSAVKGIYRSTDGINWTDITPEDMPPVYKRIVGSYAPSDENQLYFLAETPGYGKMTINSRGDSLWHSFWKYNYISGDGSGSGGKWDNRTENIPKPALVRHQYNSQGSYNMILKVKPDAPDFVVFGGTNLYRTTDGLKTSTNTTIIGGTCPDETCSYIYRYPNHHSDQHEILFSRSNPDVMYTGTDGGIHKTPDVSADRVEWESLNNGYFTTQFYTCAIDHASDNDNIIGGLQDNGTLFTSRNDLHKDWTSPTFADGFHCAVADNCEFYISSQNSSYQPMIKIWRFRLNQNGEREFVTRIDPVGGKDFIWNTPFMLDPNDNLRLYLCGGQMLWRNNNLGLIPEVESNDSTSIGWDSLNLPGVDLADKEYLSAVEVSKNPANIVYIGTTLGNVYRLDNANEGNPEPKKINGNKFPAGAYVSALRSDPYDANKVFVVFSNYNVLSLFYSEDGGESWAPVSGNLEQFSSGSGSGPAFHDVAILPIGDKRLYFAATSAGLYSTAYLDGMNTVWKQEGPETIGNMVINMLDTRESDGFVAVATHGTGVYSGKITQMPPLLAAPELISPVNGQSGIPDNISFTWKPVEGAVHYKVQLSDDPKFSKIIDEESGITETTVNFRNLDQGIKKYYWRVFANNYAGPGNPSQTWSFTTAVQSPELIYPERNAADMPEEITFRWEKVDQAESYHLLISDNIGFTKFFLDTTVKQDNFITVSGLANNEKYYWKVSSINNGMEGLFSVHYSFRTREVESVNDRLIEKFSVRSYPNPVRTTGRIEFNTDENALTSLKIYDITGALIRKYPGVMSAPGSNSINFDVSELSSGKYFYILEINGALIVNNFTVEK